MLVVQKRTWLPRLILGVLFVSFTHFLYRKAARIGRIPAGLILFLASALYAYVFMLLLAPLLMSQAAKVQPLVWSWLPKAGQWLNIACLAFLFLSLWYGSCLLLRKAFEFLDWTGEKAEKAKGWWGRTKDKLRELKPARYS